MKMKTITRIAVFSASMFVTLLLELQLVPDAQAVLGRRAVRTAVVVGSVSRSNQAQQEAAAAQQRAAAAEQEAAVAKAQAEAARQQAATARAAAPPPRPAGAQPLGRVVSTLPAGCSTTTISDVEYHRCGADYYRAAFQGGQLVYVTTNP